MTERPSARTSDPQDPRPWRPTFTSEEVRKRFGFPRQVDRAVVTIAWGVVEHHTGLGSERQAWEPTPQHVEQLAAPWVAQADGVLMTRSAAEVDPLLDDLSHALEHGKALLDQAERHPLPVTTPESGRVLRGGQAARLLHTLGRQIEADYAAGKTHHARSSPWLTYLSRVAPWLEAVGFLAFLTYFLDVPVLRPQDDILSWSLAFSMVVVVVLGQTFFVHLAARAHNAARDAAARGAAQRREALRSYRRRNWSLAAALLTAAGMTGGIVDRALVTLGGSDTVTRAVVIALAFVTGFVLPALSFVAVAFDGSKASREYASVAADLEADHDVHVSLVGEVAAVLEQHVELGALVRHRIVPDVVTEAAGVLAELRTVHNLLRVQIGGLATSEPVAAPTQRDDELVAGLPGVRAVSLAPVRDRLDRLDRLDEGYAILRTRMAGLGPHPWTTVGGEDEPA